MSESFSQEENTAKALGQLKWQWIRFGILHELQKNQLLIWPYLLAKIKTHEFRLSHKQSKVEEDLSFEEIVKLPEPFGSSLDAYWVMKKGAKISKKSLKLYAQWVRDLLGKNLSVRVFQDGVCVYPSNLRVNGRKVSKKRKSGSRK